MAVKRYNADYNTSTHKTNNVVTCLFPTVESVQVLRCLRLHGSAARTGTHISRKSLALHDLLSTLRSQGAKINKAILHCEIPYNPQKYSANTKS
eukprot:4787102-Amphidinium_carterae.1